MRGNHHRVTQRTQTARVTDDLSDIVVLSNGHWWHARHAVGLGTAGFTVPDVNGDTAFDLIQATVASQPSALAENNSVQLRHRKSTDPNPVTLASSGNVQAGWTGDTCFAGWFRLPDGDITGTSSLFTHNLTTGNQRRITVQHQNATPDSFSCNLSADGLNTPTTGFAVSTAIKNGEWQFLVVLVRPTIAAADVLEHYNQLQEQALTTAPTGSLAAVFDALAPVRLACNASGACVDNVDWASAFYCDGIPSLGDLRRMAGYYPPRTITF